jgi:hypothetical protein
MRSYALSRPAGKVNERIFIRIRGTIPLSASGEGKNRQYRRCRDRKYFFEFFLHSCLLEIR